MNSSPPSTGPWVMPSHPYGVVLAVVAAVLALGVALLLYFAARKPADPYIYKLRASFFFWLAMGYTSFLMLFAVSYSASYQGTQPYLIGGMLPIGVPWFGAIGAVTISLEGVFKWNQRLWNPDYNYWHLGRPLFGAVLGIVAFFLFVLILSSSGTPPQFLTGTTPAAAPKDFIIYYVVAFLVGYREETFRELIRRVTDMILKPGATDAAGTPQVAFRSNGAAVTEVAFPAAAVGSSSRRTLEIQNSGKVPLASPTVTVAPAGATPAGVFAIANDHIGGLHELSPNQSATVDVTFTPTAAGRFTGTLTVAGTNLTTPTAISISGTAS